MNTCPNCGQPVITTPDGQHLQPEQHPLAIHQPDGTTLNTTDILGGQRGHHRHTCKPTDLAHHTPGQEALPI